MPVPDRDSVDGPRPSPDRLLANASRAADGARQRVATTLVDLFLPTDTRLSEQQRVAMKRILGALVRVIEDEFRQRLIDVLGDAAKPEVAAALAVARVEIAAPILERGRLLHDAELIAVLLRRADEHRLATALGRVADREAEAAGLIDRLLDDPEPAIAAAAMAVLIAESRRFDRFGDAIVARTDLPAELQHRLIWWVAAALRDYMVERHGIDPIAADRPLVATASAMLAGYDETETLEGRAFKLAYRLQLQGALDDGLLAEALSDGQLALFVAALGLRAGIDGTATWDIVADPSGTRLAVLLRALDCPRDIAGDILLRLAMADGRDEAELANQLDAFDLLDAVRARDALRPWRVDGDYRRAIAALVPGGSR